MSTLRVEANGQQRGNNCNVISVFFFTADFIAYVLYLQSTTWDMYKMMTPFWKDAIETFLHSEELIEEKPKVLYQPILLLPKHTPFYDIQKCMDLHSLI